MRHQLLLALLRCWYCNPWCWLNNELLSKSLDKFNTYILLAICCYRRWNCVNYREWDCVAIDVSRCPILSYDVRIALWRAWTQPSFCPQSATFLRKASSSICRWVYYILRYNLKSRKSFSSNRDCLYLFSDDVSRISISTTSTFVPSVHARISPSPSAVRSSPTDYQFFAVTSLATSYLQVECWYGNIYQVFICHDILFLRGRLLLCALVVLEWLFNWRGFLFLVSFWPTLINRPPIHFSRDNDYSRPPSYRSRASSVNPCPNNDNSNPNGTVVGTLISTHSRDPSLSLSLLSHESLFDVAPPPSDQRSGSSGPHSPVALPPPHSAPPCGSARQDPAVASSNESRSLRTMRIDSSDASALESSESSVDRDGPWHSVVKGMSLENGLGSKMKRPPRDCNMVTIVQTNDSSCVLAGGSNSLSCTNHLIGQEQQQQQQTPANGVQQQRTSHGEMEVLAHLWWVVHPLCVWNTKPD